LLLVFLCLIFCACSSKPRVELRSLAPAETLIYMETNDLGEIAKSLSDSQAWKEFATSTPNFSQLYGVQTAIAISGFETSESIVSLNIKPKFVMILDTNSFETTTKTVVETQITKFLADAKLEKTGDKSVWTTKDNRNIYAVTVGSIAFIGNDESLIESCLQTQRGEKPSLLQNDTLSKLREEKPLAFGYVSSDGVKELSNFAGIKLAIDTSEEDLVRSFIAKILPDFLQKSVTEISWKANKNTIGIEDKFFVKLNPDVANALNDSLQKSSETVNLNAYVPATVYTATSYTFASPNIAFQGLVKIIKSQTDEASGNIIEKFSNLSLQAYGVNDTRTFFENVENQIITAQFDEDGEQSVVIAKIKDEKKLKATIDEETKLKIIGDVAIFGDAESVEKCVVDMNVAPIILPINSAITTTLRENTDAKAIIKNLANVKESEKLLFSTTQTRTSTNGIERTTVSSFGLFGKILQTVKTD
jgi:hypothetical protein